MELSTPLVCMRASYTVKDQQAVKDALELDYMPQGLNIEETSDSKICTVEVIPSTEKNREGLQVASGLLKELFKSGSIELKQD